MEPKEVAEARAVIRDWEELGVCPSVQQTRVSCTWTCFTCGRSRPATVGSTSDGDYGQSRVVGDAPNGVQCAMKKEKT
jgi:hypothetical protein